MNLALEGFDDIPNIAALYTRRGFLQWVPLGGMGTGSLGPGRYDADAQCFQWGYNSGALGVFAANFTDVFMGFGLIVNGNVHFSLFDTITSQVQAQITFNYDGSITYPGGRTVANTCPQGTWFFFELKITIGASGSLQMKVNNQLVVNATGINTNPAGSGTMNCIYLENLTNGSSASIDDMYVNDDTGPAPYNSFVGDKRLFTLSVVSAGDSSAWTPAGASSNWQAVATDDGDTSYNSTATDGAMDLFHFGSLPADVTSILAVQLVGVYRKTDATDHTIQQVIKSGGTILNGVGFLSPYAQTNDYLLFSDTPVVNDPATGLPWTLEALATGVIQAGYVLNT